MRSEGSVEREGEGNRVGVRRVGDTEIGVM